MAEDKKFNPQTEYTPQQLKEITDLVAKINQNPNDIDVLNKLINLLKDEDPRLSKVYNNRGTTYDRKGDYDNAINDFTKAIKLNSNDAAVYYNRGTAYYSKGEFDNAIKDFNKAIELNPNYVEAYNNRGIAYGKKGEFDTAIKDYTKAIELKPKDAEAYNNRGTTYDRKGDYDNAIKDYNKAIELKPKDATAYYNRGNAYYSKGDEAEAEKNYKEFIKLSPDKVIAEELVKQAKENIKKEQAVEEKSKTLQADIDLDKLAKSYFKQFLIWLFIIAIISILSVKFNLSFFKVEKASTCSNLDICNLLNNLWVSISLGIFVFILAYGLLYRFFFEEIYNKTLKKYILLKINFKNWFNFALHITASLIILIILYITITYLFSSTQYNNNEDIYARVIFTTSSLFLISFGVYMSRTNFNLYIKYKDKASKQTNFSSALTTFIKNTESLKTNPNYNYALKMYIDYFKDEDKLKNNQQNTIESVEDIVKIMNLVNNKKE
jgi:tetratricopeptide (TPR) repeat protein